jgi:CRP-like cAMP-binding protein
MQRKILSSPNENPDLDKFAGIIKSSRYFRKISLALLKEMLRQGEFVTLKAEEFLLQENHSKPPELIVLLEGSLAVTSMDHFIMRLNHSGDVVGEMSVISANPNPYADVIAEENSQVVIFPNHLFKVAEDDTNVSVTYYIFAHILAEKLRHVTARSLLKKNGRSHEEPGPLIGILDPDSKHREIIKSTLEKVWKLSCIIELESYHKFLENPFENHFDFLRLY